MSFDLEQCWLITCSRCKDDGYSYEMSEAEASAEFRGQGWVVQETNEIGPHVVWAAEATTVTNGPYVRTRTLCPQCNPSERVAL